MNININSKNVNVSEDQRARMEEKIAGFDKFFNNIVGVDVFVNTDSNLHKQGENFKVKLVVYVPGEDLYTEEQTADIDSSFNEAAKDMITLLKKKKEKFQDKKKQEGLEMAAANEFIPGREE